MILWCVCDDQAILFLCRSNYVSWVCTIVIHLHNARTVMNSVQMDDRVNSFNKRYKSWTTECFTGYFLFEKKNFSVEHCNVIQSFVSKNRKTCIHAILAHKFQRNQNIFIRCLNTYLYIKQEKTFFFYREKEYL